MYHLFAGHNYYPEPGLGDYIGPYHTAEEAEAKGKMIVEAETHGPNWWVVITERNGRLTTVDRGYK